MKEETSLSFIKSGSAALILYIIMFFPLGWWNIIGIALYPIYFIVFEIGMLLKGKGLSKFDKSQLKYYLQNCMEHKDQNVEISQAVEECIMSYKAICKRVPSSTWNEMKNHLLSIYNKTNGQSYYDILGLSPNATKSEIKSAYRKLSKKYHPDANYGKSKEELDESIELFKKINESYYVLK